MQCSRIIGDRHAYWNIKGCGDAARVSTGKFLFFRGKGCGGFCWVFASPDMDGKQPYWPETPLKCYVHPAAKRVGITKSLGWHSFRRTFATLLKGGGEDVKTVQELMRHASSRLTLDVYAQALTPAKRAAHLKLVGLIQPAAETAIGLSWSHTEDRTAVSS